MPQGNEQRRLIRLAASMNAKARRVGAAGTIYAEDLARLQLAFKTCRYCRIGLEIGQGSFDHIIPFDAGGVNRYHNLARACFDCQRSKFTKSEAEHAEYAALVKVCPIDGKEFRPRHGDWRKGLGRYCSRACSAKARWRRTPGEPRTEARSEATDQ